jgi:hypothetical protein
MPRSPNELARRISVLTEKVRFAAPFFPKLSNEIPGRVLDPTLEKHPARFHLAYELTTTKIKML